MCQPNTVLVVADIGFGFVCEVLQGIDACDGRSGLEFRPALEVALLRVSSYLPGLVDESAGGGIARPLERWTATGIVMSALVIRRGILFFGALWFSLILATNVTDGLKALQVLPQSWAFTSGNFALITTVTAIYHTPIWIVAILFLGIVIWEALGTLLFWRAFGQFRGVASPGLRTVYAAFGVSLALWAGLIVADEAFVAYEIANLEATHVRLFAVQLISLLAVRLLPDE